MMGRGSELARYFRERWLVVKVSRNIWLAALVWVVLLAVLVGVMLLTGLSSVVDGGVLGAYCGATIVVIYSALGRAAAKKKQSPSAMLQQRYGRR